MKILNIASVPNISPNFMGLNVKMEGEILQNKTELADKIRKLVEKEKIADFFDKFDGEITCELRKKSEKELRKENRIIEVLYSHGPYSYGKPWGDYKLITDVYKITKKGIKKLMFKSAEYAEIDGQGFDVAICGIWQNLYRNF